MNDKRRLFTIKGTVILFALCCIGVLGISLLIRIFPVKLSSPELVAGQPLGEGEMLAFSIMRVDMLRPFELYTFDDANGFRPLSQGLVRSDLEPTWSLDGAQLAYKSVSGWATRYSLIDADGGNRREITPDDTHKALLRWSPDGTRLAYLAFPPQPDGAISNSADLCVIEISTGVTHRTPAGNIQDLVWLPEGPALLAIVRTDDTVGIEAFDADANHDRRIAMADYLRDAVTISISPDTGKVAYITPGAEEAGESIADFLHISAIDGSETKSVRTLWTEGSIVWSPDSTKIAFVALTDAYEYALYVMDTEGANLQELMLVNTGDESGEILPASPAWSPDGARLAIASYASPEGAAVFVMNADGTGRRQILAAAGTGSMIYDLAWRPGE